MPFQKRKQQEPRADFSRMESLRVIPAKAWVKQTLPRPEEARQRRHELVEGDVTQALSPRPSFETRPGGRSSG
jgi:hypothetical protein